MLVEDEEQIRTLASRVLKAQGYTVLTAADGEKALAIAREELARIDVLVTDVVMPLMGGRELAEKLGQRFPEMRVLFTSGYTDDAVVRHGIIAKGTNFIQKPFSLDALTQKVRDTLDAPKTD